jgi:acyl-CoA thioester hydrolase
MFKTTITPCLGDTDGLGHINNAILASWFEQAQMPIFRIFTPSLSLSWDEWHLIMAHSEYDFLDQLFWQYDVEIESCIERIGTKSFTVHHEVRQNDRLCVRGKAVVVYFDFRNNTSFPIPEDKKKLLAEHLVPDFPSKQS